MLKIAHIRDASAEVEKTDKLKALKAQLEDPEYIQMIIRQVIREHNEKFDKRLTTTFKGPR